MAIAATSSGLGRSILRYVLLLALALAAVAAVLLAIGPIGWRAGWWHFRFAFLTLMPWAGYLGVGALIVSALVLLVKSPIAAIAFAAGALIAYVPWHYDQIRQTVPPIHDITTDPDNPPAFVAVVPLRAAAGDDRVAYEGPKLAEQQKRAYPDIAPVTLALAPKEAFGRALDTARHMRWTIVVADDTAGRIEASERSRWFGFTDDVVIRVAATDSGSRVDLRSSSRRTQRFWRQCRTHPRLYRGIT